MTAIESRTATLLQLRNQDVPRGLSTAHPILAGRAEGALLWDVDGNEYVDFAGGIGTMNVGHSHPRVVQAVKAQLERFTHTCFQVTMYEPYLRLAESITAIVPGDFPKKAIFFNSGAEATENAIKMARAYTGRTAVVAFTNSFHGRTLLGMSMTGKAYPYKQSFGPYAPEVYHAPFPYEYRGWTVERSLDALRELFLTHVGANRVAAVIIEPGLGEGGFVPAPAEFMRELRRMTEEHGIMLVADEIQTGYGRTGRMFALEHSDIAADLVTVAKSMAGGLPISGVVGRAEVMDAAEPGGLGGTYAGNPLACAAALAVLDVFEEERLLERAERLGETLREKLLALQTRYPEVGDVRGLGPMLAMELVQDRESKVPAPALAASIVEKSREGGLILLKAGLYNNVVRMLAPLVIEESLVERAFRALESAMEQVMPAGTHAGASR